MSTFSTNQVRHLYVAKANQNSAVSNVGDIHVESDAGSQAACSEYGYFIYKGPATNLRSDLIKKSNIVRITAKKGSDLAYGLRKSKLTLNSNVNSGNIVSGQDYVLRVAIRQYIGVSDEDMGFIHAVVHGYSGLSVSDFYKKMASSLFRNAMNEVAPYFNVYLITTADSTDTYTKIANVTVNGGTYTPYGTDGNAITGTFTGIGIEEAEQPWKLGVFNQRRAQYEIQPDQIVASGNEMTWGVVTEVTSSTTVGNGKSIADLEYFCLGERGDVYRKIGFPNNFNAEYVAEKDASYSVIDIQYFSDGNNEDVQKQQKTLSIAMKEGTGGSTYTQVNALIGKINTIFGTSVPTLS